MAINRHMTAKQRNNFRRIIAQLDKTKVESKIIKIVNQATTFLSEADIGWDAVGIFLLPQYVFLSQRRKQQRTTEAAAKVATAIHTSANGSYPLGKDGRALLKATVAKHPDWPVVREAMDIDLGVITVQDLIAVAQLLKLDDRFINMFVDNAGKKVGATEKTIVDLEELLAEKGNKNGEV